jgi:hypothetical protein
MLECLKPKEVSNVLSVEAGGLSLALAHSSPYNAVQFWAEVLDVRELR